MTSFNNVNNKIKYKKWTFNILGAKLYAIKYRYDHKK